jgi:hypothetical protein
MHNPETYHGIFFGNSRTKKGMGVIGGNRRFPLLYINLFVSRGTM